MSLGNLDSVLIILFQHQGAFVSGEVIARELSITRSAVQKRVDKLIQKGYLIQAFPRKGFCLNAPFPYKILPEYIYASLKQKITFYAYDSLISTNILAQQQKDETPFVLFTREQKGGKGRLGRSWEMQRDKDIAVTFCFPIHWTYQRLFSLIRIAAVAVQITLEKFVPHRIFIKWPNDLVTEDGRKISGILTESLSEDNMLQKILVGIGININSNNLPEYAVSLHDLCGKDTDINAIYIMLIDTFIELWNDFPENDSKIAMLWEECLAWKGQEVLFLHENQEYRGVFRAVREDGTIILSINGVDKIFVTGDLLNGTLRNLS